MARLSAWWWSAVDRSTRLWWRAVGRRVEGVDWLDAPVGSRGDGGDGWLATMRHDGEGPGLLPDLTVLDSPHFAAHRLHRDVRDFYEHTTAWRMDVWIGWSAAFAPWGALLSRFFGERVHQLAIPVDPLSLAMGLDSRVLTLRDELGGRRTASAWLRTLRSSGQYLFSGCYTTATLPGDPQPMVQVIFPLEAGNIQVFLRPSAEPDGSLRLRSPAGAFGAPGAYAVVEEPSGRYAARMPIHQDFHVYPDEDGTVRTDHRLRLWNAKVFRLHYRMQRRPS